MTVGLTEDGGWYESFAVGDRWRHARGATIDLVEGQLVAKLVVNTAQGHFNGHAAAASAWKLGGSQVVFGLVTASMVVGLATQDTAENLVREVALDKLRFLGPVLHGDTLYAYSEVLERSPSPDRPDAGLVRFRHWGATPEVQAVVELERTVLLKRRAHWYERSVR